MSCKDTAIFWKSPVNIRNSALYVEVDDGLAVGVWFEEGDVGNGAFAAGVAEKMLEYASS